MLRPPGLCEDEIGIERAGSVGGGSTQASEAEPAFSSWAVLPDQEKAGSRIAIKIVYKNF